MMMRDLVILYFSQLEGVVIPEEDSTYFVLKRETWIEASASVSTRSPRVYDYDIYYSYPC